MKTCTSLGENPEGKPCPAYAVGRCRQELQCPYQSEISVEKVAEQQERVEIPDRIEALLAKIAQGNLDITNLFLDSDTYRAMYTAAEIADWYTPTAATFSPGRYTNTEDVETDSVHLSAINVRLGEVVGLLDADVEDLEASLRELKAKKELEYEKTLRSGLRPGGSTERKIRALVERDAQVLQIQDALLTAKRRQLVLRNMVARIESLVNTLKIRARGLRHV